MDLLVLAANVSCGFEHWCPGLAYNVPAAKTVLPPDLLASLSKAALAGAAGVGAIATIRQKRRERARLGRSIDSRTLAEKLAKEARLSAAPSLTDAQVDVLASTLEWLHLAASRGMPGMHQAIAMLHESKFDAAEQILASMGKTSAAPGTPPAKQAGEALRYLGNIATLHDVGTAIQAYAMAAGLDPTDAAALLSLGQSQKQVGDLDAAVRSFERMLALGDATGRENIVAAAAGRLGVILLTRGDLNKAEAMFRRALAASERQGDDEGIASQYGDLGTVHRVRGDFDLAEAMYKKSLAVSEEADLSELSANQYRNLGGLHMQRGDVIQASAYWRKARELFHQIGMKAQAEQIQSLLREGNFSAAS